MWVDKISLCWPILNYYNENELTNLRSPLRECLVLSVYCLGWRGDRIRAGVPRKEGWMNIFSSSLLLSSLELGDTKVYEPYIRALLGTASHFCEVVVLKWDTLPGR